MNPSPERIGLVAGSGALAAEFIARARERGREVAVAALSGQAKRALEGAADAITQITPGQPKRMLRFFQDEGARRIGFAGKVEKGPLFERLKFDFEALRFLRRARNMADVTIMDAVIEFCERNGLEVVPQTEFLGHLLAPVGPVGRLDLNETQLKEARYAFEIAREIARLDVGQTVVVRKGAVVAVEAVEGTDETIRRGCALAGKGAVVCKVARPQQDPRYDIPTVGPDTIKVLRENKASVLIVEAGATFLLERARLAAEADAAGLAVVGWEGEPET